MKRESGIYKITNLINEKFYIGSCINFYTRYHNHFSKLRKGKHPNSHLQLSWNKYGAENFKFEILARCPKEYCIKLEQWFINNMKPSYNMLKIAGSRLGYQHSEESKNKIKESRRRYVYTEDHKKNISKAHIGLKFSEEVKQKMSDAAKGRVRSEETRRKMSEAKKGKVSPNKGKKFSEYRKRFSKIKTIIKVLDNETCKKL